MGQQAKAVCTGKRCTPPSWRCPPARLCFRPTVVVSPVIVPVVAISVVINSMVIVPTIILFNNPLGYYLNIHYLSGYYLNDYHLNDYHLSGRQPIVVISMVINSIGVISVGIISTVVNSHCSGGERHGRRWHGAHCTIACGEGAVYRQMRARLSPLPVPRWCVPPAVTEMIEFLCPCRITCGSYCTVSQKSTVRSLLPDTRYRPSGV